MANYHKISVKEDTKQLFLRCKEDYLKRNPKFKDLRITEDFIMKKICEFYMKF